jgi:hypothetical protein
MKTQGKLASAALVIGAGVLIIATQTAWFDLKRDPLKLQGGWIGKSQGNDLQYNVQVSPNNNLVGFGATAVIQGTFLKGLDVSMGGRFPDADYLTPFSGEMVAEGLKVGYQMSIAYGMKEGDGGPEIVYILACWGRYTKVDEGKLAVRNHFHIYTPDQLAPYDGMPNESVEPVLCFKVRSTQIRIPIFDIPDKS